MFNERAEDLQNCTGISTWNEEVLKSIFASCVSHTPSHQQVHAFLHMTKTNIVRYEASRHFRNKNEEYLKTTIDEL
jgi:uncharacterized protein (DUF952 family)